MDLKKLEVLLRAAANGYVDLCFFSLIRSGPFEYIDLVDDPMMVVLYPGHPLAKKRAIALEDLKDEPLLRPFDPPQSRRLVMAARSFRTLSPAANQFVSHTKAALRKMEPDRILF